MEASSRYSKFRSECSSFFKHRAWIQTWFLFGVSVDWVYLLRSGRGFNKGIAAVMSTTFDIWNQFIPVGKRHYKDSQGRYCDRVTSNVSRDRNFPFDISAYFKFARDSIAHYGDDPKVIPNLIRTLGEDLPVPFRNKAPETALLLAFDACYAKQGGLKYFFSLVLHAAQTDSELRDDLNNYVNFQILQDLLNNNVVRWPDRTDSNTLEKLFLNIHREFCWNYFSNYCV